MAEPEETEKYFERLAHKHLHADAVRTLGASGLKVSGIGFGGYRIHFNSVEHARALRYALLNGVNLIDTSSNYTDGGSEMLIGNLIQEMAHRKEIRREEVVVVSKVGYVQGQNMDVVQQREDQGRPFPDMVKYMDDCWHCIHPDFLQDQLVRSLDRLRVPQLDLYLLHNPEYFLADSQKKENMDQESAHQEYYRRIKLAFEWMEEKVQEGKIKAYGISSNSFPGRADDFEFTSLEKVIELAREVSPDPYFKVIQFPFNLVEKGAAFEKNQAKGQKTLLQLAAENKLGTLVNRPLNATHNGRMLRFASFRETGAKDILDAFMKHLQKLQTLEREFNGTMISKAPSDIPKEHLQTVFSISMQLTNAFEKYQSWEQWDYVRQNMILPQSLSYLRYLNHKLGEDQEWSEWSNKYASTLYDFLESISRYYENAAQARSSHLSEKLDDLNEALAVSETLSQKALRVLTSTPGVDCVLLGMRKTPYVEDALAALKQPVIPEATATLSKFEV